MQNAIVLHGLPSKEEYYAEQCSSSSNNHWLPWLQKQLLMKDILAKTPELPKAYAPDYLNWKSTLEMFKPNADTILVGHSCGAGFLLRWLSETHTKVGKVVLVAPWLDPDHELNSDFFKFTFNKDIVANTKGITVFYSDNDELSISKSLEIIKGNTVDIKYMKFHNYGHFCKRDMQTDAFPELLEEVMISIKA